MPAFYSITYENGITQIKFTRKPTYSELQIIVDDIAENFSYRKRLWDLSNIYFDLTIQEIQDIARYGKKKFIRPNSMAIIAPQDLAFGTLRAFEVYRTREHAMARVFRTEEEAVAWLESL